jgi:hypothetical protein
MSTLRVVRRNSEIYIEDESNAPVIVPVSIAEVKPHQVYERLMARGLSLPSKEDFFYVLMQVIYRGEDFEVTLS